MLSTSLALLLLAACGDSSNTDKPTVLAVAVTAQKSSSELVQASAYNNVVQRIYVGYFGRPADPGGLAYFSGLMASYGSPTTHSGVADAYNTNAQLRGLVEVFSNSQESKDVYSGDNGVFMDAIYRNLFGRLPDAEGKAYWVNVLDQGFMTRVNAVLHIMAAAQGSDIHAVNKRVAVANMYTFAVNTPARSLATEGSMATTAARSLLGTIMLDSDIPGYQAKVDTLLAELLAKAPVSGMYSGQITDDKIVLDSLVLENGQYWGFYSGATAGLYPNGFIQGIGASAMGVFSSPDAKNFGPAPATAGAVTANYVLQSSLDGSITVPAGSVPYTSAVIPSALYNYNTPARLSDIAQSWTLLENASNGLNHVDISAEGVLSAVNKNCSYSGSLKPRSSNKNVFDVALAFGAGTCRLSGQSATGVAFTYQPSKEFPRRLVIAVVNSARTAGVVLQSGLVLKDTVIGTGAPITPGKNAVVHYTGWLYDGNAANQRGAQFDTSAARGPYSFDLGTGNVIKGWHNGVEGMRVGGKRTLILSGPQGYGARGSGAIITPNATLMFDVELISYK